MTTLTLPLPADATAAQVLGASADVIARRGKAVKTYEDCLGRVCVLGAMRVVLFGTAYPPEGQMERPTLWATYMEARELLAMHLRSLDAASLIAVWSDRSREGEVVAVLRAAAERAA